MYCKICDWLNPWIQRASLVAQLVKNLPAMREIWVRSLAWEDPLEKGKGTHSSTVRHNWVTFTFMDTEGWLYKLIRRFFTAESSGSLTPLLFKSPLYDKRTDSIWFQYFQFSSVTQSCPTLLPHVLQYARLPCPSPTPRAYSNSCPLSWRLKFKRITGLEMQLSIRRS